MTENQNEEQDVLTKTPEITRSLYADIEVNKMVSEFLRVKALKENESATYKLIISDFRDTSRRDQNDQPLLAKPGYRLHHTCKIIDPITSRRIQLRNITGYTYQELPGGVESKKPKIERFQFPKGGLKIIGPSDQDTYAWLERHNGNRDNPFRDKSRKAIFYRVNPVRRAMLKLDNDFLLIDALAYVRDADMAKLKAIYASMSGNARKDIDPSSPATLKSGIFDYTKQNPILAMKASEDKELKLKIAIMECENYNLIMFDEGDDTAKIARQWMFADGKPICEVDISEHKIDGLTKYFKTKEGFQVYAKVTNQLKQILNPR